MNKKSTKKNTWQQHIIMTAHLTEQDKKLRKIRKDIF